MKTKPSKKDQAADCLHISVRNFVEAHGGIAVSTGPIGIMREFPEDKRKFEIVINCMGRMPRKSSARR